MYSKFEQLLKAKGVTAYRVSQDTGIAGATLTNWKKGGYTPKIDKLQTLADYFGVPLSYFTEEEPAAGTNSEPTKKIPKELKKLLEDEEIALNGRMMTPEEKQMMLRIIEATFYEIKELNKRKKQ